MIWPFYRTFNLPLNEGIPNIFKKLLSVVSILNSLILLYDNEWNCFFCFYAYHLILHFIKTNVMLVFSLISLKNPNNSSIFMFQGILQFLSQQFMWSHLKNIKVNRGYLRVRIQHGKKYPRTIPRLRISV